jgi:GNAT superfamily N-acetyltransferase
LKAKVEIFYFGCCPWSYSISYGDGFLDKTWTKTGGDFKAELEKFGVEVVEYSILENKESAEKNAKSIDPYNPFSNQVRFIVDGKEVSKDEFFQMINETREEFSMEVEIEDVTKQNIDDLVRLCAPRLENERHAHTFKDSGLRKSYSRTDVGIFRHMVSRMTKELHFLPIDLQAHRCQVFDLMVEYYKWIAKDVWEHFKIDILADGGFSSVHEYVASYFDGLVSEVSSRGVFYLVESGGVIIGMGALDKIRERAGAIKRMYIRPAYQGKGIGKALLQRLLQKAKEFGYHSVYLETGISMTAAQCLYRSVGFVECDAYPETEIPSHSRSKFVFMEKDLQETTK